MVHGGPFWLHGCRTVCTYAFARLHFLCSRYGRRETQRQSERGRERESNTERTMKRSNNHTETKKLNATGRRCTDGCTWSLWVSVASQARNAPSLVLRCDTAQEAKGSNRKPQAPCKTMPVVCIVVPFFLGLNKAHNNYRILTWRL